MLILTRKEGESLRLGDDITVTVVSVKGGNVRVGITAPRELAVHREEIYQKISEDEAASSPKPGSSPEPARSPEPATSPEPPAGGQSDENKEP